MTIATKRNITESKQAEEALQESEEQYKTLVENAPIGIYFNDFRGTFLYGNKKAEEITGYKRKELLGKSFLKLKLLDPKELSKAVKLLALNKLGKATGPDRFVLNRKDGTKSIVEIHTRITTFGGKKVVLGMVEDVTERKKAEEVLRESEEKYRTIFENVSDVIIRLDKYGKIIDINGRAEELFGYKPEEMIGKNSTKLGVLNLKDLLKMAKLFSEVIRGKCAPLTMEAEAIRKDGTPIIAEVNNTLVRKNGKAEGFVSIIRDITERKKAEQALADESTWRRILVDQSRDGIVVLDYNGKVYEANRKFAEMLGYTPAEARELHIWDWDTQWSREQLLEMVRGIDATGDHFETYHRRKDGTTIDVEISTNGATVAGQKLVFCVCRDITERKRIEEKEKQYIHNLASLSKTATGLVELSPEEDIYEFISNNLKELANDCIIIINSFDKESDSFLVRTATGFGKNMETISKILGRNLIGMSTPINHEARSGLINGRLNLIPGGLYELACGHVPKVACQMVEKTLGLDKTYAIGFTWKGGLFGSAVIVTRKRTPLDNPGIIETFISQASVALQRRQAEEQIRDSLKEKEVLLKEIHHRVKNNLQVISSLLNLQSMQVKDIEGAKMFTDSQNRVKSMALIHEKLYRSKDLAEIEFSEYLDSLVTHLFHTYAVNSNNIQFNIDADDITLNIDTAITCGLIVNEIVSNSLKYAFPDSRKGEVRVRLHTENEQSYSLIVGDNGIGFPEDLDFRKTASLGMQLVCNLTNQFGGSICLNRTGGTEFKIEFTI